MVVKVIDWELYFHMRNHYKKLNSVKGVVNTFSSNYFPKGAVRPPSRSQFKRPIPIKPLVFECIQECQEDEFCSSNSPRTKHFKQLLQNSQNASVGLRKHSCRNRHHHRAQKSSHRPITRRNPKDMPEDINDTTVDKQKPLQLTRPKTSYEEACKYVSSLSKIVEGRVKSSSFAKTIKLKKNQIRTNNESRYIYDVDDSVNDQHSQNNANFSSNLDYNNASNKRVEEQEYMHFLLRITEDIIKNDLYTNSEISALCNSHIAANKQRLDEKKMLLHLHTLYSELGISADDEEDDNDANNVSSEQKVQKTQKDIKNSIVCICKSDSNQTAQDCECSNPLRCEPIQCKLHSTIQEEMELDSTEFNNKINNDQNRESVSVVQESESNDNPVDTTFETTLSNSSQSNKQNYDKNDTEANKVIPFLMDDDCITSIAQTNKDNLKKNYSYATHKSKSLIEKCNIKGDYEDNPLEIIRSKKNQQVIEFLMEYKESAAYLTDPSLSEEIGLSCKKPKSTVSVFTCNIVETDSKPSAVRKSLEQFDKRKKTCSCGVPKLPVKCSCPIPKTTPHDKINTAKSSIAQSTDNAKQPPKKTEKCTPKKLLNSCSIEPDFCAATVIISTCSSQTDDNKNLTNINPNNNKKESTCACPTKPVIDETKLMSKDYDLTPEKDEPYEFKPILTLADLPDEIEEPKCACRSSRDLSLLLKENYRACPFDEKSSIALPYPLYYFYPSVATQTSEESVQQTNVDILPIPETTVEESQPSDKSPSIKSPSTKNSSIKSAKQSTKSSSKSSSKYSSKYSSDENGDSFDSFNKNSPELSNSDTKSDESSGKLSNITEQTDDESKAISDNCSSSSEQASLTVNADDEEDKEGIVEFLDELNKQPLLTVTRSIENQVYNVTNKLRRFREVNEQRTISPEDVLAENVKKTSERDTGYVTAEKAVDEQATVIVEFIPPQIDFSETVTGCCSFKKKKQKKAKQIRSMDDELKAADDFGIKGADHGTATSTGVTEASTRKSIRLSDMVLYRDNLLNDVGVEKRKRSIDYIEDAAEANNVDKNLLLSGSPIK